MPEPTKIKILPENLINQIAAGEVVDRPASVVKELVENSLDSGATDITVIVQDGGKGLIRVVDNGSGMSQSDLLLAFQRHATSKIFEYEDLTNITTLGFRGEALASIASVARVEAKTVQEGEPSGHLIRVDGGMMSGVEVAAGTPGTSISVKHLFYNTPARRKFLRARNTEYRQLLQVMNRFYLAYPEVAFTFVNEDEVITELKPQTQEERIRVVLGPRIQKNLLRIDNEGEVSIRGYIGNQDAMRRSRGDQYLYYNRRYFTSRNLNYAVTAAYGEILPRGSFPVYLIFIDLPPERVDVNVHPTKMEIKFDNEPLVFASIRGSIKRVLTSVRASPDISPFSTMQSFQPRPHQGTFMPSGGSAMHREAPAQISAFELPEWNRSAPAGQVPARETGQIRQEPSQARSFERTNVWQIHNRYIISQIKNGMIIIDQHVAHERILYEKALDSFEKRKPSPQQLLFPQVVELSTEDYSLLLEITPFLQNIGFIIKAFGNNTVAIEAVPSGIRLNDDETALLDILDEYKRGKRDNTEIRENIAASFACHTAIRSGEPLNLEEMNALIDDLFSTKEPYFCPHGRPVIIHVPLDELDRRFKRI
jgi:DNA mismatch repair protein MutL